MTRSVVRRVKTLWGLYRWPFIGINNILKYFGYIVWHTLYIRFGNFEWINDTIFIVMNGITAKYYSLITRCEWQWL